MSHEEHGHSIWHKADLRSFVALMMIGVFITSWFYFLVVTPVDETKELDATTVFMMFVALLIGTLVGVFSWLGFKQGAVVNQNGTPAIPIEIPDNMKLVNKNGINTLVADTPT